MNERELVELRQRATKRDPESMFRYGSMLFTGRYFGDGLWVGQRKEEGLRLVKEAGAMAYRPATEYLASLYGLPITNEPWTKPMLLTLQAQANKGDAKAQYRYGSMLVAGGCFESGLFVDSKIDEGLSWIKKAAVKEYKPAIDFLSLRDKTDPEVTLLKVKLEHIENGLSEGGNDWRRFLISVLAGVVTFFLTQFLFGRGFKDSTIVGFIAAVIIGILIKVFFSDSTDAP